MMYEFEERNACSMNSTYSWQKTLMAFKCATSRNSIVGTCNIIQCVCVCVCVLKMCEGDFLVQCV